ncbi:diaminopimelate epimerase [Paraburkholderia caballeronis]|nr:diaminopimelate epimerase [Paraburkholderia caballeronis]TDV09969.1 diaminopimelate epimerase [Paraburkholderia caballeronis]TDV21801.1 diaminopimelate epimerase [Paraburkholderia caballeronis]
MTLHFIKMQANGDDFVVVDARGKIDPITSDVARRLGDRNRGIGFDQLAVALDCDDAAARLLFWNPDGTPLDTCGSATRGVAELLMREAGASSVTLRTARGRLSCGRDIPLAEAARYPCAAASRPSDGVQHGQSALHVFRRRSRCHRYCRYRAENRNPSAFRQQDERPFCPRRSSRSHPAAHLGAGRRRTARVGLVLLRCCRRRNPARSSGRYRRGGVRWRNGDGAMGRGWRRCADRTSRAGFFGGDRGLGLAVKRAALCRSRHWRRASRATIGHYRLATTGNARRR